MVDKLARRRFLAVVGTSGSGKSSLVNLVDCARRCIEAWPEPVPPGVSRSSVLVTTRSGPWRGHWPARGCCSMRRRRAGMPLDQLVEATLLPLAASAWSTSSSRRAWSLATACR
ncbi:MAG: hypothetical protein MZW92_60870 [Comamonadaceae bacterium]|nr:hypothetical protein [Comamonadaceae bacterium]